MSESKLIYKTISMLKSRLSMLELSNHSKFNTDHSVDMTCKPLDSSVQRNFKNEKNVTITFKDKTFLNANIGQISVDNDHYKHLGDGDDGDVILAENKTEKYVLKVFKRKIIEDDDNPETVEADQKEMDEIVADQALRELTALKLMSGHPNVSKLISTEVDTCNLHMDGRDLPESILVRMEYIPHAITLEKILDTHNHIDMATLGIVRKMRGPDESFHIDFGARVKLIAYLFGQCYSVSRELKRQGIYHRDCDACNIVISFPSLRLVLLDFARAEIKEMGIKKIKLIIDKESSEKIQEIKYDRYTNKNINKKSDLSSIFYHLENVVLHSFNGKFFKKYEDEREATKIFIKAIQKNIEIYYPLETPVNELIQFEEVWQIYKDQKWRIEELEPAVNNKTLLKMLETENSDEDSDPDSDERHRPSKKVSKS